MKEQVQRDIKRLYQQSKKRRFFLIHFQKAVTGYIESKVFPESVNWMKMEYELKTIARKCKQKNRSAKCYLRAIINLVLTCLKGKHKLIDAKAIIQRAYKLSEIPLLS